MARRTNLVSDGDSSLDVDEAICIAGIDLVDDMEFLNPLGINLSQPSLVIGVSLKFRVSQGHVGIFMIPWFPCLYKLHLAELRCRLLHCSQTLCIIIA